MDHATINRQKKVLAMVEIIDKNAVRQNVSPFDQAGRILLTSQGWPDKVWHQIALDAGYPSKVPPRDTTREMIRVVYRSRAQAPLQKAAS